MYAIVCAQRIKKGCSIVDLKAVKLRLDFIALDTKSATYYQLCSSTHRKVDWKRTFENYQLLTNTVENFSEGYALYFFVAEFVLLISYVCISIGMVTE